MKLTLSSDYHITADKPRSRLDNTIQTQFDKLSEVLDNTDTFLLQAGDFTEKPRSWSLLSRIFELLNNHPKVTILTVFGQHDTYMHSEATRKKTNLGILTSTYAHVLSEMPFVIPKAGVKIYGTSYGGIVPEPEIDNLENILVIHAPISDKGVWHGHEYMDAKWFLGVHTGYRLILCGDIHRHFLIQDGNRSILNTGPLLRYDASEYNITHEPCYYILDTETWELTRNIVKHEPGEKVLNREQIEITKEKQDTIESAKKFAKMIIEDSSTEGISPMEKLRIAITTSIGLLEDQEVVEQLLLGVKMITGIDFKEVENE